MGNRVFLFYILSAVKENFTISPHNYWTNGVYLTTNSTDKNSTLSGFNAIALVAVISEGRTPSFENTVYSTFVPESLSEVQSIQHVERMNFSLIKFMLS